jgi:hypothetical protein
MSGAFLLPNNPAVPPALLPPAEMEGVERFLSDGRQWGVRIE